MYELPLVDGTGGLANVIDKMVKMLVIDKIMRLFKCINYQKHKRGGALLELI